MKITLTDIENLPEGLKGALSETDGKHELDLSGLMAKEDLTGLKSALEKERANVAAWKKLGETPDDVTARIEELSNAKPKGKNDEEVAAMLKQVEDQYKGKLEATSAALEKTRRQMTSETVKAELAKHGALPDALDVVANFANSRMVFADDGSLQIMTSDGKPMVGSGENHTATIADLAKDLASSMAFAFKDTGTGGGGKPPQQGGTPQSKTITRTQWDGMSHSDRSQFSKDGGKVVDG